MHTAQTRDRPWSTPADEVLRALATSVETGLDTREAEMRLARHGPNVLADPRRTGVLRIFARQFVHPISALLGGAAGLSLALGENLDAAAIALVLLVNAGVGAWFEWRAQRSLAALRAMNVASTRVRRNGAVARLETARLVPGDIVLLEGGDLVGADLRLVEAAALEADESALTGESMPVAKSASPVAADADLADRTSLLHSGTMLTRGCAVGVVVATGAHSELGRIAALVSAQTRDERTPLEARLSELGRKLIGVTIAVAVVSSAAGLWRGESPLRTLQTAIALAVAAIPEALPIVATVVLARGMHSMARRNALTRRLSAVETLGATNVLVTDKTGTLTKGELTFHSLTTASGTSTAPLEVTADRLIEAALTVGVLCNNATLPEANDGAASGDPLEIELLRAARSGGLDPTVLRRRWTKVVEEPFESTTMRMTTIQRSDGEWLACVKGAAERVMCACSTVRERDGSARELDGAGRESWRQREERLAQAGMRVLALAAKRGRDASIDTEHDLEFLGLAAFVDPPRVSARTTIARLGASGIRVVMATGDQAATAAHIARAVGITGAEGMRPVVVGREIEAAAGDERALAELARGAVFARVAPEQKLHLVRALQRAGAVVAMIGDGVNDAPALRQADIGVAMGKRGTDVAREAADLVLLDDELNTVVIAVEQGRVLYDNLRTFVRYLLSCNLSEVVLVGLGSLLPGPTPLLPLQILFVNLVTDVAPALALALGAGDKEVMERTPRSPDEPFLTPRAWTSIVGAGIALGSAALLARALAPALAGADEIGVRTITLATLIGAQLGYAFQVRAPGAEFLAGSALRNPRLWLAISACAGATFLATEWVVLRTALGTRPLSGRSWLLVLAASAAPLLALQLGRLLAARRAASAS